MGNFITNIENATLKDRLIELIKVSKELKFLVGFFYFSGWREIYNALKMKKNDDVILKILVGLEVDKYLSNAIEVGIHDNTLSQEEYFERFIKSLGNAINNPQMDNEEFYNQVDFFIKLLEDDRLIIRKTVNPNHAKLYLFKLKDKYQNLFNLNGEFITGSSNLTKAGLHNQDEFNVEIRDYGFEKAEDYFDKLWDEGIPITEKMDGKKIIIDFLKNRSQTAIITPYEAYAYVLKTYIDLYETKKPFPSLDEILEKNGFKKYTYQMDAVNQALNIIETYGGVIIADVVGLGKSVIASLIAKQLGKRGLILCPPGLIGDKRESTGWYEYWYKFELYNWDIESIGKIEEIADSIRKNNMNYEVIIVDEAHRFRNQDTDAYEALSDICRGKIVILLTATPFSNTPADIFSLLKLFIVPGESGITIEPNLEERFFSYNSRFRKLSFILKNHNSPNKNKRKKAETYYAQIFGLTPPIDISIVKMDVNKMAGDIKNVISPVIIRRNRLDLKEDFEYKKEIDNISKIRDPEEIFYTLTRKQSEFYDMIINDYFGEDGKFKGAIYRPYEYETDIGQERDIEENRTFLQQRNLFDFMRRLLVKRFESSFGAFSQSIERFLKIHKMVKSFIEVSGKYILDRKVIESIYNDEDGIEDFTLEAIKNALEEFKNNASSRTSPKHTKIYEIKKFKRREEFLNDIDSDIKLFEEIKSEIENLDLVNNDPKREKVLNKVREILNSNLNPKRKVVIFTEYTDTVLHLEDYFREKLGRVVFCKGSLTKSFTMELEANFNARSPNQEDEYDVLITTDKLSEGINLNRAGAIINYDIPWNPTRVIQRVGRINRIGTKVFDELFIYNIFPTEQGASEVKIREIAQQKMFLIHNALGEDAKIFDPDEEPTPSGLFKKINFNPDEEGELNVITIVRNEFNEIKNKHPEIIKKINKLPNRTKTAKHFYEDNVVVFRRKGLAIFSLLAKLDDEGKVKIFEKNFQELMDFVKSSYEEKRLPFSKNFWKIYGKIKEYKPTPARGGSELSIESKAFRSLKSLIRTKEEELDQDMIAFIGTLIKDIRKYKTLSKNTLRRLVLQGEDYAELIENIMKLRERLGSNYLDKVLERAKNIEDEIIISVENIKSN